MPAPSIQSSALAASITLGRPRALPNGRLPRSLLGWESHAPNSTSQACQSRMVCRMAECFRAYPCSVCISRPVSPSSCRVRPLLGWRCVPHPTKVSQRDTASGQFHELSSVPTCSEPERRDTRTRRVVALSSLIHYIAQSVVSIPIVACSSKRQRRYPVQCGGATQKHQQAPESAMTLS